MSLGILNLHGGNIGQHMTGDIVTSSEKNMENWDSVGEITISYANGINTLNYENVIKPSLHDLVYQLTGVDLSASAVSTILTDWGTRQTWTLLYTYNSAGPLRRLWIINNYVDHGSYISCNGGIAYNLSGSTNATITERIVDTAIEILNKSSYNTFTKVGLYTDINTGSGQQFSGYISKDFTVESGNKYFVKFLCYSPSGFNAVNNNVIITSGSNTINITIDNENTTDYEEYYSIIQSDGSTLNIKFDLSTMASADGNIELKVTSTEIYKLN